MGWTEGRGPVKALPNTNTAPRIGQDPHDFVIQTSAPLRKQIADYIRQNGTITNACSGAPCRAGGWNGG